MTPVRRASEDTELMSFRIPSSLREAVDDAATRRQTTATAVVRTALEAHLLGGPMRVEMPIGFLPAFDDWVRELESRPGAQPVLVVLQRRDTRLVYEGVFDAENSGRTFIALKHDGNTYVLPRAEIVMYEDGGSRRLNKLAMTLRKSGFRMVTAGPGY